MLPGPARREAALDMPPADTPTPTPRVCEADLVGDFDAVTPAGASSTGIQSSLTLGSRPPSVASSSMGSAGVLDGMMGSGEFVPGSARTSPNWSFSLGTLTSGSLGHAVTSASAVA